MDLLEFEKSFESALDEVSDGLSVNRATLQNVLGWIHSYLQEYRKELAQFPGTEGDAHWELAAFDNPSEDAVFVAMFFLPDTLRFVVGRGSGTDIRHYCEHEASSSISEIPSELAERFQTAGQNLSLPPAHGYAWIELGWSGTPGE